MTPKDVKVYGSANYVWRNYVSPMMKEKAGYICKDCGSNKKLDIHHESYIEQNINNFICLCKPCHSLRHQFKRVNEKEFVTIVNKFNNVELGKLFCIPVASMRRLKLGYLKKLDRIKENDYIMKEGIFSPQS